jgi:glycosyltransferase involved in cell wall biosynthesis
MPCVLFFGFIREYKGLDILIRAFVQVMTRIPASVLVVAGGLWTGSWADSTYSRLVNALGLQSHVKVFSDYIPLNQVSTYFAAADVVAVPYKRGTQSGVIQLSYAFEKPVVATDVGGLPEVVEDGRSGRVVPAGDTEALAAALIELLQQPAARSQMGQYGYRLAQGRHSWETIAQQILQVYQRLCE